LLGWGRPFPFFLKQKPEHKKNPCVRVKKNSFFQFWGLPPPQKRVGWWRGGCGVFLGLPRAPGFFVFFVCFFFPNKGGGVGWGCLGPQGPFFWGVFLWWVGFLQGGFFGLGNWGTQGFLRYISLGKCTPPPPPPPQGGGAGVWWGGPTLFFVFVKTKPVWVFLVGGATGWIKNGFTPRPPFFPPLPSAF